LFRELVRSTLVALTYEHAREIVRQACEPGWTLGTFCIDDRMIVENDTIYAFSVGPREWIVDGDERYAVEGAVPVVFKDDGRLAWVSSAQVGPDDSLRERPNPAPTLRH
jgi:hypothetical protein